MHDKIWWESPLPGQTYNKETKEVEDTQTSLNRKAKHALYASDWNVIRELERMFLKGTPLNVEREALRDSVVEETTNG